MSLYFLVLLGTLLGPFLLSFDKKIHFYTYWKPMFTAILIVAIPFVIWDEIFTSWGLWGFNSEHVQGLFIGNLPIEEICFFFFVPYACIFVYEVLVGYFSLEKTTKTSFYFSVVVIILGLILAFAYHDKLYSFVAFLMAVILTIAVHFVGKNQWFGKFVVTFLVVQIPFVLVNGILTGMFTEKPIVWYNSLKISNLKIGTIPLEDLFYNYSMLLLLFFVYNLLKKKQGLVI